MSTQQQQAPAFPGRTAKTKPKAAPPAEVAAEVAQDVSAQAEQEAPKSRPYQFFVPVRNRESGEITLVGRETKGQLKKWLREDGQGFDVVGSTIIRGYAVAMKTATQVVF